MAFRGSLHEVGLAEVCQLLSLGKKSGCLTLADQARFGQIFFDAGRIVYANVRDRRDRLGDLLVRDGVINYIQLLAVVDQQANQPDRRIGELLVEHELISPDRLAHYVRLQIEEAVYHLLGWVRGTFEFEAGQEPPADATRVSLSVDGLMLESARRTDEWEVIRQRIHSLDLCYKVDRERIADADVELSPDQEQIIVYLDGSRSVRDIMALTGRTEFEAGKALYGLIQAGFASVEGSGTPDAGPPDGDEATARELELGMAFYRSGMLDDAAEKFRGVLDMEPEHTGARFYLAVIALRQDRFRDAMQHLRPLMDAAAPHPAVFLDLALGLMRCRRLDQALLAVEHAETLRRGIPLAALLRGSILLRQGRPRAAATNLAKFRRRLPAGLEPPPSYFHEAALAQAMAGRLAEAEGLVGEGMERYPTAAPLLILAGAIAERKGDTSRAEALYRRAAETQPALPHAYRNLGDIALESGQMDAALEHYERAIQAGPELGDTVYERLGTLHHERGSVEQAIRYLERALQLNPENDAARRKFEEVRTGH